jgi:hypothetical protein
VRPQSALLGEPALWELAEHLDSRPWPGSRPSIR